MKNLILLFSFSLLLMTGITNAQTAYITNDTTVTVIDVSTNAITATIQVGSQPLGVSVSLDGTKVYITNIGNNTVSVINALTNTVTATIPVGISPFGLCVTPDGSKVYVANFLS